jgi:hypothetical protein
LVGGDELAHDEMVEALCYAAAVEGAFGELDEARELVRWARWLQPGAEAAPGSSPEVQQFFAEPADEATVAISGEASPLGRAVRAEAPSTPRRAEGATITIVCDGSRSATGRAMDGVAVVAGGEPISCRATLEFRGVVLASAQRRWEGAPNRGEGAPGRGEGEDDALWWAVGLGVAAAVALGAGIGAAVAYGD